MSNPIADQLRKIADEIDKLPEYAAGAPVPLPVPEGMVAVYPTGVRGAGKVRYWPDPWKVFPGITEERLKDTTIWSYSVALTQIDNPATGGKWLPPAAQVIPSYGGPMVGDHRDLDYHYWPEIVDRWANGSDWATQEQLDEAARIAERNRDAKWVAVPDAPAVTPAPLPDAGTDVPIPDEE